MEKFKYYGVYVSEYQDRNKNNIARVFTNYEEVVKYCKENRKARFKGFCTEEEATEFCANGSTSGSSNPYCSMESLPFKALKSQDLFQLRKCIETNDYEGVKKLIWKNPRYLISEGDGATILQEGARYNALHICAKHGCASIAELILETVSNNEFIMLLYGSESECSYVSRTAVLLDSLLNTPDKSLCETALHFAVKYGSLDTVKVFLSYPQCQKDRTNKFHQKPIDIVCSRVPNSNDINVKNIADEIRALLVDGFLIPVWRSPVNDIPPIIGDPFSPPYVPVSPTNDELLSPVMEITALAGPMSFDDALEFRKKWKTACKINSPSSRRYVSSPSPIKYETTPTSGKQSPQRSYVNLNKSVEHRGRNWGLLE